MTWKRITKIILVFFLLLGPSSLVLAQNQPQNPLQKSRFAGKRQIVEPIKIATLNNFPPFSFVTREKLMGFTIDYIHLLAKKTGLEFEIVPGTWEKNLARFKKGEVDMITAISYTEERTAFTRYTDPYYIIPTVVYVREGSFSYQGVQDLQGKTVGIESGIFYKKYLQQYPRIRIQEIEDTNELMRSLSFAEVDAVITNINIGNYMIKKHMLENVELAGRIDIAGIKDEDLRIGVRRDLGALHAIIQAGINRITPGEYKDLQDRWVDFSPGQVLQGDLLPDEYELINEYKQNYGGFRLSPHPNWYPVDFFDAGNNYQGIAADIFARLSEKQNIPFVQNKNKSFEQSIAQVINEEAEIIPAVVPGRHLQGELSFTKPYLFLPLVIATRNNEIFIEDLRLLENKSIGFVKNEVLETMLRTKYPELEFVQTGSVQQGLQQVRNKKVFAFLGTLPTITFSIQKNDFYNIKISGTLPEKLPVSAAVKKGNQALLGIVQKALNSISLQEREKLVNNWISIRLDEKVDYTIIWIVSAAAVLVVMLSVAWTRKVQSLNNRIFRVNQLLTEKNRELELLSTTDKLTGLFNRSKVETELEKERKRFLRQGNPFSVIILDIDWFKSINDNYGHQVGDEVLQKVAACIRNRTRVVDITGRWGGEEFLVICPGTDLQGAGKLAEDIRRDIQKQSFGVDSRVSVSAGVASFSQKDMQINYLLRLADNRLYKAKEKKNTVVMN